MRTAEQTKAEAVMRKTTPVLATTSRTPASAGPTKKPRLSIVLATAFAAVSSPGVRAAEGVTAAMAGRNGVPTKTAAAARA